MAAAGAATCDQQQQQQVACERVACRAIHPDESTATPPAAPKAFPEPDNDTVTALS
jgi:hypothetical protein